MITILSVSPLENYQVRARFSDGLEGIVDLSDIDRVGVFSSWNDPQFFQKVFVDPDSGTLAWPGEIDLDPYVLYARASGRTIEEVLEAIP